MSTNDIIDRIRTKVQRCSPNCGAFAYSIDRIDQIVAEAIRDQLRELAVELVDAGADDATVRQAHAGLVEACKGDDWATKEVAGRLLSLVHRLRLTRAISRHPRAGRFESLVRAIQRGRYTSRQLKLAQRLAAEAGA